MHSSDQCSCTGPRARRALSFMLGLLMVGGCEATQRAAPGAISTAAPAGAAATEKESLRMWMTVGDRRFAVTLSDNATARSFAALLPLTIDMSDLNDNEKHAKLPRALAADASKPGTIRSGDIMLWGTDTLVVFYLTFDSAYSYTRIGRVDDPAGLAQALGPRDARITFSKS